MTVTLDLGPEVKSAVFVLDSSIEICTFSKTKIDSSQELSYIFFW